MILRRSSNHFHMSSIEDRIRGAKNKEADKAIRKLIKKHLQSGDVRCTLKEVHDALIEKGVDPNMMSHQTNDFRDILEVKAHNALITLGIPLFPRNKGKSIDFSVNCNEIHELLDLYSTPESIADYLIAISDWLPEYMSIEERLMAEEKQRRMACDIALDLLKKTMGEKLSKKGYQHEIFHWEGNDDASLKITYGDSIRMTFEVNLLNDFLSDLTGIIDSLPVNAKEVLSMSSLKNILYCVVIDEYDDELIAHLKEGGNNVIIHDRSLWIPNMYKYASIDAHQMKDARIYVKEDTLPNNAPIATLKAIDAKLGEFIEGCTEAEREDFIQRLISGEGYAGHYNRHRYKMPPEILITDDLSSMTEDLLEGI